jgi:hypothetical protein
VSTKFKIIRYLKKQKKKQFFFFVICESLEFQIRKKKRNNNNNIYKLKEAIQLRKQVIYHIGNGKNFFICWKY